MYQTVQFFIWSKVSVLHATSFIYSSHNFVKMMIHDNNKMWHLSILSYTTVANFYHGPFFGPHSIIKFVWLNHTFSTEICFATSLSFTEIIRNKKTKSITLVWTGIFRKAFRECLPQPVVQFVHCRKLKYVQINSSKLHLQLSHNNKTNQQEQ